MDTLLISLSLRSKQSAILLNSAILLPTFHLHAAQGSYRVTNFGPFCARKYLDQPVTAFVADKTPGAQPSGRDGKVFLALEQLAMIREDIDWWQPKRLLNSLTMLKKITLFMMQS